jgi:hypothetical protein
LILCPSVLIVACIAKFINANDEKEKKRMKK